MKTTGERRGQPDRSKATHFRDGDFMLPSPPAPCCPTNPRRGRPDRSRTGRSRTRRDPATRRRLIELLGSVGVDAFLELVDVLETTFVGNTGKGVVVNATEDGLEFSNAAMVTAADLIPQGVGFSYLSDGSVSSVTFDDGRVLTFTYLADGAVDEIADNGVGLPDENTKTFAYNSDGTVDDIAVAFPV